MLTLILSLSYRLRMSSLALGAEASWFLLDPLQLCKKMLLYSVMGKKMLASSPHSRSCFHLGSPSQRIVKIWQTVVVLLLLWNSCCQRKVQHPAFWMDDNLLPCVKLFGLTSRGTICKQNHWNGHFNIKSLVIGWNRPLYLFLHLSGDTWKCHIYTGFF